jgi:hypothetical protein
MSPLTPGGTRTPGWIPLLYITHTVGLLCTSDQLVAEAATYTTHNKHNRRTSMLLAGFEPAIPAMVQPQTYVLDDTATGIGFSYTYWIL